MPRLPNYIQDTNPFNLGGPPVWFLRRLMEFDPSLVIIPSREGFMYRLAQRRPLKLSEKFAMELMKEQHTDAKMLASYGLINVTTIAATANWDNPLIFVELHNRAPWRQGGGDVVADRLDAADLANEVRKQAAVDAHLTSTSRDGWQLYRNKIGLGRTMFIPGLAGEAKVPTKPSKLILAS